MTNPSHRRFPIGRDAIWTISLLLRTLSLCCLFGLITEAEELSLAQARTEALSQHPRIAAAQLRAAAAGVAITEARAAYYPQITAVGTFAGGRDGNSHIAAGALNNPSVYDRAAVGLVASQLITDFGRTSELVASVRLRQLAQQHAVEGTQQEVLYDVDRTFFTVLEKKAVLSVAQATVAQRKVQNDRITALSRHQLRSDLDVGFSQVALGQAQLLLAQAQDDLASSQLHLKELIGRPPQSDIQPAPTPTVIQQLNLSQLLDTAMSHHPLLLRLEAERQAQLRFAKSVGDQQRPVLSLIGVAGYVPEHDSHLSNEYEAGAINLSVSLFNGFAYHAQQQSAQLEAQAIERDLEDARRALDTAVRTIALTVEHQKQVIALSAQLMQQSELAQRLAESRYQAGSLSIVELNQAQLAATQEELDAVSASYEYRIGLAHLDLMLGYPDVPTPKGR